MLDKTQAQSHGLYGPAGQSPNPARPPRAALDHALPQGEQALPTSTPLHMLPSCLGHSSTSCSPGPHLLTPQYLDVTSSGKAALMPKAGRCILWTPTAACPFPHHSPHQLACDPALPPRSQKLGRFGGCSPGVGSGAGGRGAWRAVGSTLLWCACGVISGSCSVLVA